MIAAEDRGLYADVWTPDGQTLVYSENRAGTDYHIWSIAVEGSRSPELVAGADFYEGEAAFSPDGEWIAFTSEAMGQGEIYLQPFPGPGPTRQVSQDGGRVPTWLSSGELIYVTGNRVIDVPIQTSPSLVIGRATTLLTPDVVLDFDGFRQYDPTRDGQRLVAVQGQDRANPDELAVIVNFSDQLRRLAPAR